MDRIRARDEADAFVAGLASRPRNTIGDRLAKSRDYSDRWVVERTLAWLHQFRRLRQRDELRADIHLGFLTLAACLILFRRWSRFS